VPSRFAAVRKAIQGCLRGIQGQVFVLDLAAIARGVVVHDGVGANVGEVARLEGGGERGAGRHASFRIILAVTASFSA